MPDLAIEAEGLVKHFGSTRALDGLDLAVPSGTILALLGPNGAGKTTAVRILATLLAPDAGRARVLGLDVASQGSEVRAVIGLAGQYAALDERLTGAQNLDMIGRLYHLRGADITRRKRELLDQFALTEAAGRPVLTYSGGMRRRLDLAASLIAEPPVLYLDEPTTGLDPRGRLEMWDLIQGLVAQGTTLLLTTQYLEEADRLADDILVVNHGRSIAHGTADELKGTLGGERVSVTLSPGADLASVARVLERHGQGRVEIVAHERRLDVGVTPSPGLLAAVIRDIDATGAGIDDLQMHRPTLDDVFLALTGEPIEPESASEAA